MKYLLFLVLFIPNYGFSQPEEILRQTREKLEKLNQVEYRSTFYMGGMAGEWYADGVVNYENRNNHHLVSLKYKTDLLYNFFGNEQKLELNKRLPPHSWFLDGEEQIQLDQVRAYEAQLNDKHPFGTTKEAIYNGREFLGYEAKLGIPKVASDPINLRTRSHLIVLDLLKGLEKKGKVVSYVEGADTHRFVLEGGWPQGTLRSNQVIFHKVRRIELILDKKELLPLILFYMEEWGLSLMVWEDYKFDVTIDEKIWKLNENTGLEKEELLFYEDENGVEESYQISSKKVFYEGTELVNCDPKSFQHLGKYYYRDSSKIFFAGEIVANADLKTFNTTHYYVRDKNNVYSKDRIIVGADPAWFGLPDSTGEIQKFNHYYLTDGNKIYEKYGGFKRHHESYLIEEADANSFELLKPIKRPNKFFVMSWARDKHHVFNREKIIENADPETVVVLNQYHAKDKYHYIMGSKAFKNDSTFILFPNLMAKNKEGVYQRGGTKLKDADPETFIYLNDYYSKDKDRVFHEGFKPFEADAATFKAVGKERFGYDKSYVFFRNSRITSANPATWQLMTDYYSKDQQSVYYCSKIIVEADAATFKVIEIEGITIGVDKNGKYLKGRFADEAKVQEHLRNYKKD